MITTVINVSVTVVINSLCESQWSSVAQKKFVDRRLQSITRLTLKLEKNVFSKDAAARH